VCVCLSVREDISGTTGAIFAEFFVHVAYVGGVMEETEERLGHRRSTVGRCDISAATDRHSLLFHHTLVSRLGYLVYFGVTNFGNTHNFISPLMW